MKRLVIVVTVLLLAIGMAGCSQSDKSVDGKKTYKLDIGHNSPIDSHYDQWAKKFKELVEKKSDNQVKIKIHKPGSLGAERELIESVLNGSLDIAISSDAPVVNFADKVGALSFPFLFDNEEQAYKALDGKVGSELNEDMKKANLKNLHWMETGFYHIFTNKPIHKLDDLNGMKYRSQESDVQLDFLKDLGMNPSPIDFGELYQAMQQGTIDGFSSSYATLVPNKLDEVAKYENEINLYYSAAVAVMNNKKFEGLPKDIQKDILESAKKASNYERNFVRDSTEKYRQEAKKNGLTIVDDVDDIKSFKKAVQPVYDKYNDKYGDIHKEISEIK